MLSQGRTMLPGRHRREPTKDVLLRPFCPTPRQYSGTERLQACNLATDKGAWP